MKLDTFNYITVPVAAFKNWPALLYNAQISKVGISVLRSLIIKRDELRIFSSITII